MPQISVIVPVYKAEAYIHRCIDSILAQTFSDFEVLLVDDGSPDRCGEICEEYAAKDKRIRVFHQVNQGQGAARNHALDWVFANSDSEYISFVDSDDWVHPRYLELLREGLRGFDVNICQCSHQKTEKQGNYVEVQGQYSCISAEEGYTEHYSPYIWEKMYRRDVWSSFRFPEGQIYEDLAVWYKVLFSQKQIAIVDAVLYFYFWNNDSTVHQDWHPGRMARLDAWEAQVTFFERQSEKLLLCALDHFVSNTEYESYYIGISKRLSEAEKKQYTEEVSVRARRILKNYRKQLKQCGQYRQCFELAHPLLFALYQKGKILVNR